MAKEVEKVVSDDVKVREPGKDRELPACSPTQPDSCAA